MTLHETFDDNAREISDYLMARDFKTRETWLDFCRKRGFTVEEMMDGLSWQRRLDQMPKNSFGAAIPSPKN
jgi:hypothetical protein